MNIWLRRLRHAGYLLPTTAAGYLIVKGLHPGIPGISCPFRALTGVPCPGCFLTRATAEAFMGNWTESVELHAFGPITAALVAAWSIQSLRTKRLIPKTFSLAWIPVGASALFSYWLLRVVLTYAFPTEGPWDFPST